MALAAAAQQAAPATQKQPTQAAPQKPFCQASKKGWRLGLILAGAAAITSYITPRRRDRERMTAWH